MRNLLSILSVGLFRQMLRSATPVALAAMGGAMTEGMLMPYKKVLEQTEKELKK